MNLRRQLLLVSLLLITLPWAGCQYVREMEAALQSGQEQALLATTRAVATMLSEKPELLYPELSRWQQPGNQQQQLYAASASEPVFVDGYADGWEGLIQGQFGAVDYRAKTRGPLLYLLFAVRDSNVVYQDPRQTQRASGDRLVLRSGLGRDYIIAASTPGPVQARSQQGSAALVWEPRIRGQWQDSSDGYTIELELPLSLLHERLGFYLLDETGSVSAGNILPEDNNTPWLIYSPPVLRGLLDPFASSGIDLQVVDAQQWIIGSVGSAGQDRPPSATHWLLRAVYRAILNHQPMALPGRSERSGQHSGAEVLAALQGSSSTGWYASRENSNQKLLSAAAPVFSDGQVAAVVVAQQSSDQYLSLTDRAFSRLLLYSLAALLISALGLLGYASWLSWRVRELSLASAQAFRPDGSLANTFPVSHSRDEIGELSRQYAQLLERLREYTDYLRSLSRKLSHELRTPIAVIQSSLDNLEQDPQRNQLYLQRAREGLNRLGNILTAMSEATRLEESVHHNQPVNFDLAALCRELCAAYQSVYPDQPLQFDCALASAPLHGVADLIAQLLDKLVDNAASFAAAGTTIRVNLAADGEHSYLLSVSNQGPLLPAAMQRQLFDSMVSVREGSERVHLGLGLHIVRLIVDFHRGSVRAANLDDGSGVIFILQLPAA